MTHALRVSRTQALFWIAVGLVTGLAIALAFSVGGTARADVKTTGLESVRTSTLEASLSSKTHVWIRGSGFVPGTEIRLLIADGFGVQTDITITGNPPTDGGGSVYPLIVNDDGAWATDWLIGRFARAGVGAEGMYTLGVYDADFNLLATAPLALCNPSRAEGEAVPSFCSQ